MKNSILILLAAFSLLLSACGAIEDLIEDSTRRTISISRTIHDDAAERDVKSVAVAQGLVIPPGGFRAAGPVSVDRLSDSIEVSRLGIGETRFFLRGVLRNESAQTTVVTLGAVPNGDPAQAINIGTITLAPYENLRLESAADLPGAGEIIHQNLTDLFSVLTDEYLLEAVVYQSGNAPLIVENLKFAALPVYWKTKSFEDDGIKSYKKHLDGIHDAMLKGSVTNKGDSTAEVRVYMYGSEEFDAEKSLIAQAYLAPGETISGYDMTRDGGESEIESVFKDLIDGDEVFYDFVVVSKNPVSVISNELRAEIRIDVVANIF
ncbi:MAG: hypothetical protein P9L99_08545 [Candidatus Lernaella stagnicola]|nr:hypothetical protein [Candidatus Lernaella stagnicola]